MSMSEIIHPGTALMKLTTICLCKC